MTNNEKFKSVDYSETDPGPTQELLLDMVSGGKPCLLISVELSSNVDGLKLTMQAGGGISVEDIEPLLEKALLAFRQGKEELS